MKGSFAPDYTTYSTSVGAVKTEADRRIAATWTGYPDADIVDDRFAVEDVSRNLAAFFSTTVLT